MILLDPAPYAPFADPRQSRLLGLMPLDPAGWFVVHADFAGQMAYRERLLAGHRDTVLAQLPEGAAAAGELLDAVAGAVSALPGYSADREGITRPDGATVTLDRGDPLVTAGRLVADDLCVLLPDAASGEYRLAAAVLCFPSHWLLSEKIGRPLTAIHDPVPDYGPTLARRVNRVFEALKPGRPLWRVNWSVDPSAELFLPLGRDAERPIADRQVNALYLRTERQTLSRLPETGAVIFGIKTSVTQVGALTATQRASLQAALRTYDAATIAYKSGAAHYHAALDYLAEISCHEPGELAS